MFTTYSNKGEKLILWVVILLKLGRSTEAINKPVISGIKVIKDLWIETTRLSTSSGTEDHIRCCTMDTATFK
jgi:hypothetical protein